MCFKLLFEGYGLEEDWSKEYKCYRGSGRPSHQPRKLLFCAVSPHQILPLPGCVLVQTEQHHTRCGSQSDSTKHGSGQGGGLGEEEPNSNGGA